MSKPTLSVLMLVYQHAAYVEQAIDSVLAQKDICDLELIIIDDASTDDSASVCAAKAKLNPDCIRFIRNDTNQGMHASFACLWQEAQGRYIAFCEGDDYWLDDRQLLEQIACLDARQAINLVGAKASVIEWQPGKSWHQVDVIQPVEFKEQFSFTDLIPAYSFHFSTVMLRKSAISFPDWFSRVYCVDRPLYLLATLHGDAVFIDETVSCYRLHDSGNWSTLSSPQRASQSQHLFTTMRDHFPSRYRSHFAKAMLSVILSYVSLAREQGDISSARHSLSNAAMALSLVDRIKYAPIYLRTLALLWFSSGRRDD